MTKQHTLEDIQAAVEEAVHHPTLLACLARAEQDNAQLTDKRLDDCGGTCESIAARLGVDESEAYGLLVQAKEQGGVYSTSSRLSEMTRLWWFEGLADRLVAKLPEREPATPASVLMNAALSSHPALTGNEPAIPFHWNESTQARVVMVSGDNASGKSFVTKQLNKLCQSAGYEVCCSSMRHRTGDRMFSAMVYGDERRHSTGQCSVRATLKAFRHAQTTDKPCVIILDEPDIGLSAELAEAMGDLLVEELEATSDKLILLVVISHNRELFKKMQWGMGIEHWSALYVGAKKSFAQWLTHKPEPQSTDALRQLPERAHETYRKILDAEKTR